MTLVDDQQIDCIVRIDESPPRYIDVQIKARSMSTKYPGTFAAMDVRDPRPNFFFIFYSEAANTYWVMPSLDLIDKANVGKSGKAKGKNRILFTNTRKDGTVSPRPKWKEYENAFDLLKKDAQISPKSSN